MRSKHSHKLTRIRALAFVFTSIICISGLVAQGSKSGSSPEQIRVINVPQKGAPPTGPDEVVIEQDPGLPADTVYRPSMLGASKHPLVVWGEGGCAKNGLTFPEFLTEIASYGFVVVADGPPVLPNPNARPGRRGNAAQAKGGLAQVAVDERYQSNGRRVLRGRPVWIVHGSPVEDEFAFASMTGKRSG